MTGPAGDIVKRPDSEEPIEHDGVVYFFAATLRDLDPFAGRDDARGFEEPVAGWGGRESYNFGRVRPACKQSPWVTTAVLLTLANNPDDNLVLWPDEQEAAKWARFA